MKEGTLVCSVFGTGFGSCIWNLASVVTQDVVAFRIVLKVAYVGKMFLIR